MVASGREGFVGCLQVNGVSSQPQRVLFPDFKISLPELPKLPKPSAQGICNFLSGGVAGALAAAITCPLEVVKTHLQSSASAGLGMGPLGMAQSLLKKEGVKGLYRGMTPTLMGIIPTRSTYFWALSATKGALLPVMGDGPATHVASAVAGGTLSITVTCPLWMVKTRMQLTGGKFGDTVRSIVKENGVKGLYRGLRASYWGLTESCSQFLIYEKMKKALINRHESPLDAKLTSGEYLAAAGASKAIASILTYPHEVVRTRMREVGGAKYRTMFQSIKLIAKEEGRKGLYGGLGPHLMRVVPNTAIMFMTYELLSLHVAPLIEDGTVQRAFEKAVDALKPEHLVGSLAVTLAALKLAAQSQARNVARLATV